MWGEFCDIYSEDNINTNLHNDKKKKSSDTKKEKEKR